MESIDDFCQHVESILCQETLDLDKLSQLCEPCQHHLGFADVEPDQVGQLVEALEKQVAHASQVQVISEAHLQIEMGESMVDVRIHGSIIFPQCRPRHLQSHN